TFMDLAEIQHYEKMMRKSDYIPNTAQKRLAEEVTRIVHGEQGLNTAQKVTKNAAPGAETVLDVQSLEILAGEMPSFTLPSTEVVGIKLIDLLAKTGLQTSKSEARRLIRNGGVYINNMKVLDENFILGS